MPEYRESFWKRARKAANYVFRPKSYESKKSPYASTVIGLGGNPQYSLTNFQEFYQTGYEENSLIYAAITYKAKAMTQAKFTAYHYVDKAGKFEKLEFGNELQKLLDKPNKYMSGEEFHTLQNVLFNLTGNAFTYIERKQGQVVALWPLNPAWVTIIPDKKGEIAGYEYRPYYSYGQPYPITYDEMAHWKLPNPNDQLNGLGFGMSPVLALANAGDIDNMISRFLNVFFKNGALPAGILKFKDISLDDNEMDEIREKWRKIYGGFENWDDIGILDQYGEYQRIGFSFQELDFGKLDQRNETRIFASLGVPLELLPTVSGLTGSTYNNKSEARQMFWQDTMMFELNVVKNEIGRFVNDTESGVFVDWDLSSVYALKGDLQKQVDGAFKLYQMGMPPRIAYETVGLAVESYKGIDDSKPVPQFGQTPFGQKPNPNDKKPSNSSDSGTSGINNPDNIENAKNWPLNEFKTQSSFDLETKAQIYDSFDSMLVSHEPEFVNAANKMFEVDQKEVLTIIGEQKSFALEQKASINWLNAAQPVLNYFNGKSKDEWRKTFAPLIQGVYEDTGNFWGLQLGLEFDIRNIEGELALADYTLKFSDYIAQTNSDSVKAILQTGYADGYTFEKMTNELQDLFGGWESYRSERIARTETIRAGNAGAIKLYDHWGIKQKEWLATADDRTRDNHLAMNEQIVDIDKPFESPSGAKLMQPGDANAPLSETVNCRCMILPILNT